jgi:hypothetical protein
MPLNEAFVVHRLFAVEDKAMFLAKVGPLFAPLPHAVSWAQIAP